MKKIWFDTAWKDYLYWQTQDKKTLKRINKLLHARLEIYDKLAESQREVESGEKLLPLDEVFAKYRVKYGVAASENV